MKFSKTLFSAIFPTLLRHTGLIAAGFGLALFGSCGQTAAAPLAAHLLGRLPQATLITVTLTLPLRRQAELHDLLRRLSAPADPAYGHYLTPQQFADRFSPTQADYDAAAAYAQAQGLTVTGKHANRLLLDVSGPASALESVFKVHLNRYQDAAGRVFHQPDTAPTIDRSVAGRISGVAGLSDAAVRRPHLRRLDTLQGRVLKTESQGGTGPQGGLAPSDIRSAYSLSGTPQNGSGQTLALFEIDGYDPGDISAYESYFGLPAVPLQNILLNTATGAAGDNSDEVTLDIEMQTALAPGASRILVYETGTTDSDTLDGYSRIADDDIAKQISTSWGLDEPDSDADTLQAENTIFEQMAAQGQTIYAAAGDSGAYDTGYRSDGLAVDDPASQPYVCGVGGTTLSTNGIGGPYLSETTWNSGSIRNGAGGGGISSVWPLPAWQQAAAASSAYSSPTMRNVPDISLDSDPNTGYAIYYEGAWYVYGGTSAAAPLWAGLTALVNQQRAAAGLAPLGQANPALYSLLGTRYASDFHDIADGSTNLYYPAETGYDNATGLGTPIGSALLADLAGINAATTHVLWDNTGGAASIWSYSTAAGTFTQNQYGPYAGWTAKAVADGEAGGPTQVLWNNTDGAASLWSLNNATGVYSQFSFGPYSGWTAAAVSVAHVLWDNTGGAASIWNYSAAGGTFTQNTYGPYSGWTAKTIADGGTDGRTRVLWDNANGQMSLWSLNNTAGQFTQYTFGPYPGWTANAVSVGTDNTTHILWDNTNGEASLWNYSTANGTFTQNVYGPYAGWTARAIADGADGQTRVLWEKTDGTTALWNLNNTTGTFSQHTFGPLHWMDGRKHFRKLSLMQGSAFQHCPASCRHD